MYDRWSLREIWLQSVSSSISRLRFPEQGPRSLPISTHFSWLKSGSQLSRKSKRLHHPTVRASAVCRTFEMTLRIFCTFVKNFRSKLHDHFKTHCVLCAPFVRHLGQFNRCSKNRPTCRVAYKLFGSFECNPGSNSLRFSLRHVPVASLHMRFFTSHTSSIDVLALEWRTKFPKGKM
jgi:hypothetical protein